MSKPRNLDFGLPTGECHHDHQAFAFMDGFTVLQCLDCCQLLGEAEPAPYVDPDWWIDLDRHVCEEEAQCAH